MTAAPDATPLRRELISLFNYMQRLRQEIAAIYRPADDAYHFERMSDQLDAIVQATEEATNIIMNAIERNEELIGKVRARVSDAEALAILDQISQNGMKVLEACSFQDITGQRVNKIVKSLAYVGDWVNGLIEVWGKEGLEAVEVKPAPDKTADEMLLHGPQLAGQGISQDEVDKLFR